MPHAVARASSGLRLRSPCSASLSIDRAGHRLTSTTTRPTIVSVPSLRRHFQCTTRRHTTPSPLYANSTSSLPQVSSSSTPSTLGQSLRTVAQFLSWPAEESISNVTVHGYVRSTRKLKEEQFVNVGDGSCNGHIQAIMSRSLGQDLRVGSAIRLHGDWVPSTNQAHQTHELKVRQVDILGPSDPKTHPLQNKYQTSEYLRSIPHFRTRLPLSNALLRLRSDAIAILTNYFAEKGFTQCHPPIITSSDCEGAGEVFTVANTQPETSESSKSSSRLEAKFFRSPKYLTVSSQLHLEAMAQSLGHVWTLSPAFRAEKSETSRHLSEFYMLEAEMAFLDDMDEMMDLVEDMLRTLAQKLWSSGAAPGRKSTLAEVHAALQPLYGKDPDICSSDTVEARWKGLLGQSSSSSSSSPSSLHTASSTPSADLAETCLSPTSTDTLPRPWPRITYTNAIKILQETDDIFEHKPVWGVSLQTEHEKYLARVLQADPSAPTPIFITHYPRDVKAFYMQPTTSNNSTSATTTTDQYQRQTVNCFDMIVPDLCEMIGGSMREHRLDALLEAMQRMGIPLPKSANGRSTSGLDWYVDLRRWGSPPHGGFGLGFDRLLSYLSGVQNVKDVVAYPRWAGRCDC